MTEQNKPNSWKDFATKHHPLYNPDLIGTNADPLKDFRDNGHEVMDTTDDLPNVTQTDKSRVQTSWETTNYKGVLTPEEAARMESERRIKEAKEKAEAQNYTTATSVISEFSQIDIKEIDLAEDIRTERQQEMVVALLGNTRFMEAALTKFLSPEALANYINLLVININK